MRTAVIATKGFNDFQILSWHLMDMAITELLIPNEHHLYHMLKKFSESNDDLPLHIIDTAEDPQSLGFLYSCGRLVVFWDGKHRGIAVMLQKAREIGIEVSVVYAYPPTNGHFAQNSKNFLV